MKTIGILGGGQIGGMLSTALYNLGAKVIFYDPDPLSPSFFRTYNHFEGTWNDYEKLKVFFSSCDTVTYEFENVSTTLLDKLVQETGTQIYPSPKVLSTTQNRIFEKSFLKENNFPVCKFIAAQNIDELKHAALEFSFPYIIKTATGGYDGKGQWHITNSQDFKLFINDYNNNHSCNNFIIEEKINIAYEASCIIGRNLNNEIISFPIFDNVHKNQILYQTTVPSVLPTSVQNKLKEISIEAAKKLEIIGLLTTEFFITKQKNEHTCHEECDGYYIYVNEFAPRPHNSGHITLNSCTISQFDILARILLNLPIHEPKLIPGYYCLGNILGNNLISKNNTHILNNWTNHQNIIDIMIYGKKIIKENRKMGHFIAYSNTKNEQVEHAEKFRECINEK